METNREASIEGGGGRIIAGNASFGQFYFSVKNKGKSGRTSFHTEVFVDIFEALYFIQPFYSDIIL